MLVHDLPWYVDAAFTVHVNGRRLTGGGLHMKKGFAISISGGQKLTTRSSTEAGETVGVDDCMSLILRAQLFLKAQGIKERRSMIRTIRVASYWREMVRHPVAGSGCII
jgi:hypothetical protein